MKALGYKKLLERAEKGFFRRKRMENFIKLIALELVEILYVLQQGEEE